MTRGRAANTVLVNARDPQQAIDRLADAMMRGTLEVTLDDARRAAHRELGRASRNGDREALVASYHAGAAGTVIDLSRASALTRRSTCRCCLPLAVRTG